MSAASPLTGFPDDLFFQLAGTMMAATGASSDTLFSVANRSFVVTGGMGQLGQAFAGALSSRMARVAIVDTNVDANRLSPTLQRALDEDRLMLLGADVTSRPSLEAALQRAEKEWGTPHGLLNNAGIDSPPDAPAEENGPFETYPETAWDMVMDVNVKGVFLCCQVFGAAMAAAGRGSIVNVSSIYGAVAPDQSLYEYRRQRGETFFKPPAYSASKSALYNFTRYLAVYWAHRKIRVNTVTFAGVFANQDQEFLDAYTRRIPIGRMANPEDYCAAIIFLLSDGSGYMTGADLAVDGGWCAW